MTGHDLSPEAVEALAAECDRLAGIGERRAGEEVPPSVSLSLMRHVVRQHTLAATLRALSARLAAAERRAEEAEARLDSDRLCDALSEALDEQAHLTSQGGALDMHRLARAVRALLWEAEHG